MGNHILLIITGGIAAYKTPELARRLMDAGHTVTPVLSESATQFVTPLALASVSGSKVYGDLFSLTDEHEMGHIRLARDADLVLVAPATANVLAKMAHGEANDLGTTILLATEAPVLVAPAMNWAMWDHPATRDNMHTLESRGVTTIGPVAGDLACGEEGMGRMADIPDIVNAVASTLKATGPLSGTRAIVTSGPTHEPIDPVRYIANRSSGKQGHAIAAALAKLGCDVTLVSGPTVEPTPKAVKLIAVETAVEMMAAVEQSLPADIFVGAAAVADWRASENAPQKIKKDTLGQSQGASEHCEISLTQNPDILKTVATIGATVGGRRPTLVIGFAAETQNVIENARTKLASKGCDWILANDVSTGKGTFGGGDNEIHLVTRASVEDWPRQSKLDVGRKLAGRIADTLAHNAKTRAGGGAS